MPQPGEGLRPAAVDIAIPAAGYELYYLALAGRRVTVEMTAPAAEPRPDTESTLRIPAGPARTAAPDDHAWRLVALAHRAMHQELGTRLFSLDRADRRLRPARGFRGEGRRDLEVFLDCFADRGLAWQLFQTLEDLRVDSELPRRLPGLRHPLRDAATATLSGRPALDELPPRAAAIEVLIRRSVGHRPAAVPAAAAPALAALLPLAHGLARAGASVEDTALATVLAYGVVTQLPNLGVVGDAPAVELVALRPAAAAWSDRWPEPPRTAIEGDQVLTVVLPAVPYRDDLHARVMAAPAPAAPIRQTVYTWGGEQVDAEYGPRAGIVGPPEPLPHEHHEPGHGEPVAPLRGALPPGGAHSWLYPEWDNRRGTMLARWCRVHEELPTHASADAVHRMAMAHRTLVTRLHRVMAAAAPRALAVHRGTGDGDDIDFDAAVEALIDRRSGVPAREQVYQRLDRRRRDAVVGVLVDASCSTGARLLEAPQLQPVSDAAARYHDHPRVLDLALLSTVLCLQAAQAAGDASAAWAFSGSGRDAVRFRVLKAVAEPFSGRVIQRAAGVRPDHATRLGAALRHATAALSAAPHALRTLLVLTDGQPYDEDYGQQYGEDGAGAYALADTAHALVEARRAGVRACIVAIGSEAIALADACGGDVVALDDITALPERLTTLYQSLTVGPGTARLASAQPEEKRWELEHDAG